MKSRPGFFAAIAFLLVVPIALLAQFTFGSGADLIIHFIGGVGFALSSLAVFDFKLPRWITWIGFGSAGALAVIFLLQGVSNLIPNASLDYLAFQVLGQWLEGLLIDLFLFWFVAMWIITSVGRTRIFGFVVLLITILLEVSRYSLSYLGGSLPGISKLWFLMVFVWFLFECIKQISFQGNPSVSKGINP